MIVRVLPAAVADLLEGACLYNDKEEGLGRYFFNCLSADIQTLRTTAGVHRKVFGLHRLISKRFPYLVYYSVGNGEAIVWRVLDGRVDPQRTVRVLRGLVP